MISLSEKAVHKVKECMTEQQQGFVGVRVAVTAGGCSGFQYAMNLERQPRDGDRVFQVDGLQVFVDEQSMLYLDGTEIDYVETIQGEGFKFSNPNVTGACGCGESFQF